MIWIWTMAYLAVGTALMCAAMRHNWCGLRTGGDPPATALGLFAAMWLPLAVFLVPTTALGWLIKQCARSGK